MSTEILGQLTFPEKMGLIKAISKEVISYPAHRYRKLADLLIFCQEPKDIDVVIKAISCLCEVFCDIIPSYRIRELKDTTKDGEEDQVRVSKQVEQLRNQEQFVLSSYKEYLQVLETFSKAHPPKMKKEDPQKAKVDLIY
mmetsp:Transcript_3103/g.2098  ORF Transcript_3103/g.2098 Transcript_3103/m.2098 type:complete len:140 (+) Transcript_3103:203-622(+)